MLLLSMETTGGTGEPGSTSVVVVVVVVVTFCGKTCLNPVNRKRKYTTTTKTRTQNENWQLETGNWQLAGPRRRRTDGMQHETHERREKREERREERRPCTRS